jgi:hypothetical protein
LIVRRADDADEHIAFEHDGRGGHACEP